MATANLRIKLSGGSSDRAEVDLAAGTPVDAFSVGSDGGWKVSAPGVNAVHAYLFFDGTTLFVACAAGSIVQLGATTVGTDWKPVSAPATISLGSAALEVEAAGAPLPARSAPVAKPQASAAPVARPQSAPVQRPEPSAAPAARTPAAPAARAPGAPAARPPGSAAPAPRGRPSVPPPRPGKPDAGGASPRSPAAGPPRTGPSRPGAAPARPGPPPLASRPQTSSPRATSKPVRPPAEVIAAAPTPAPAFTPGASDYDEGDSPTQYQPMPEGFSEKTQPPQQAPVGPSSEPPTAIHSPATAAALVKPAVATADDEEAMSEERTRVLSPTDVEPPKPAPQPAAGSPKRTMLGMAPPPPTSDAIQQMAQAAPSPPKPERPEPPSVPQSKESATVVRPLEEFLAEAGQRSLPADGPSGAGQGPPWAPDPFGQTQPPVGRGDPAQAGAYGAQQPGAYGAQQPGAYGAQQPGAYGAQQPGAYGAQQPGAYGAQQHGAYGEQQAGAYGAQQGGAYGAQQAGAYGAQQGGAYGAQQPGAYGAQQPGAYGAGGQSGSYGVPGAAGASGQFPQQLGPDASGQYGQQQYPGGGYPQPAWGAQQAAEPPKGPLAIWKAMPFPRKLMFIMLPFGLIAFIIVFSDPPQRKRAPSESSSATPATSASGAPGTSADPSAAPPTSAAPPATADPSAPSTASAAPPEPPASAKPPDPTAKPADPAPSATAPALAKGEVTLERKAADAVASNDFAKAAELYEQLAKQHPDNPAYARGAEILRKKAKK